MKFDLLNEPWLPVVRANGTPGEVGIREALVSAHVLRSLVGDNPAADGRAPPPAPGGASPRPRRAPRARPGASSSLPRLCPPIRCASTWTDGASGSTGAADRERLRMARELVREVRVLDRNLVENGRRLEAALRVQGSALTLRREPATCFRR